MSTTMVYKLYDTLTIVGIADEAPLYRNAEGLVWVGLEYGGHSNIMYPVMYNATDGGGEIFQINCDEMNSERKNISFRDFEVHIGRDPYGTDITISELTWKEYEKKKDIDPLELIARLTERIKELESKVFPL